MAKRHLRFAKYGSQVEEKSPQVEEKEHWFAKRAPRFKNKHLRFAERGPRVAQGGS